MTKKDYEFIANIILNLNCPSDSISHLDVADAFAKALHKEEKNFKAKKFLKACGVTEDLIDLVLRNLPGGDRHRRKRLKEQISEQVKACPNPKPGDAKRK